MTGILVQENVKIDFQDSGHGSHLGFPFGQILAIFDLQVTMVLLIKFWDSWGFRFKRRRAKWIFKLASMAAILDFRLKQFQLFLIYKLPWYYLRSFKSIGLSVQEKKCKMDFQDGGHVSYLGFLNGVILAIFDLRHSDISYQISSKLAYWFRRRTSKYCISIHAISSWQKSVRSG